MPWKEGARGGGAGVLLCLQDSQSLSPGHSSHRAPSPWLLLQQSINSLRTCCGGASCLLLPPPEKQLQGAQPELGGMPESWKEREKEESKAGPLWSLHPTAPPLPFQPLYCCNACVRSHVQQFQPAKDPDNPRVTSFPLSDFAFS